MEKIRSFDVFDNLFARRYINSNPIWDLMEQVSKIPNFASNRKSADNANRNLTQIYEAMASSGQITEDKIEDLRALEVAYEQELIFPIKENIQKVRDGDILVSDMYMSGPDILKLVRSVGMDKQVTIYQSNGDKATGAFWNKMKGKLDLEYHLGDNIHSDVNAPNSYGFNGVHYPNTNSLTNIEQNLINNGLSNLGLLIREIRLKNYEQEYQVYFDVANQKNLVWIFIACELLFRKYKGRKLVFLGRDCQLMYKIYSLFFDIRTYYLPFSRAVALSQPEESVQYLKSQTFEDSVLVDISSTGRTWEILCKKHPFNVEVLIYSDTFWYSENKPTLPETFSYIHQNSVIGDTNIILEIFNCGNHGKLREIQIVENLPICKYGNTELPQDVINVIHKPVNEAVELRKKFQYVDLVKELSKIDRDILLRMSTELLKEICATPKNSLNIMDVKTSKRIIDDFEEKENMYLEKVAKE